MNQALGLHNAVKTQMRLRKKAMDMASKKHHLPRVIAVTSGKGGVGKTNLVGNMAVALSQTGQNVVIIDADVGLANIDIIFNLRPEYNIRHLIHSEKTLNQVMVTSRHGIRIIPGGNGFADLTHLSEGQKLNLLSEFETLSEFADIIFVDTGAGISSNVLYFNAACDECIVIATREPPSITDAYAMIKVLSKDYGTKNFKLIVNMVSSAAEAKKVYASLSAALDKYLNNVVLEYIGHIPFDRALQKAVQKRALVMDAAPESTAAMAIEDISERLVKNVSRTNTNGSLTFFINKVFQTAN